MNESNAEKLSFYAWTSVRRTREFAHSVQIIAHTASFLKDCLHKHCFERKELILSKCTDNGALCRCPANPYPGDICSPHSVGISVVLSLAAGASKNYWKLELYGS